MKASKYLFLIFMSFAMGVVCHSKTIAWEILPSYSNIQRHGDNSFIVEKNGKYGLVSATGGALLSPEYDFITPFINGYSLVCTGTNESAVINKIISDDGTIYTISRKYYVDTAHPFVSDGLLCVANANSKVGYIDVKGNEVIRCQFDDGLPFKEGWASVKDGRLRKYVNRNYDNNAGRGTLAVNFHFGDMTSASCFNNGQAVIAYNKDFALINTGGNVIRKLNESEAKN
ncbi:MAG: WG repeat-containing protein, partial [Muribaculaceae bacterium]